MTIPLLNYLKILGLLIVGSLPISLHFQSHQMFTEALVIQTSKVDPPRIAFDLVNLESQSSSHKQADGRSEFTLSDSKTLHAGVQVNQVDIEPMVFTENDVIEFLNRERLLETLTPTQRQLVVRIPDQDELFELKNEISSPQQKLSNYIQQLAESDSEIKRRIETQQNSEQNLILGEIELQGGLPTGPQWITHVFRTQSGQTKETGQVIKETGEFKISVPEKTGYIVAQLKDRNSGLVIGEGSYRLNTEIGSSGKKVSIKVNKSYDEVAAGWFSFYENPNRLKSTDPKDEKYIPSQVMMVSVNSEGTTDPTGHFKFDQIKKGSWTIVRNQTKEIYPGINLVRSGSQQSFSAFSVKMIEALREIIYHQNLNTQFERNGSVVWGQVLENGKPASGAEIEIENNLDHPVVYLNSLLLPDPNLKATSDNGYFVVLDLPAGIQSLIAKKADLFLSHVNVIVDENSISNAELVLNAELENTEIKVYDAFLGSKEKANLEFQSLAHSVDVLGFAEVKLPQVERLSFVNVNPENPAYLRTTMSYSDLKDYLHIPLISSSWLQGVASRQKINLIPQHGIIVGFLLNEDDQIYLGHLNDFDQTNIVYFDSFGNSTDTSVTGGGFIIFNVPPGPQSVVKASGVSDLLDVQVVDINLDSTVVVKF